MLAVILYFGISFAVQAVHVEGLSMFATLDDNDYLIANKIDYRLHAPQRGDIIILRPPSDNSKDFIKRIIALPGERILISDGIVYINGHKLDEPYLPEAVDDSSTTGAVRTARSCLPMTTSSWATTATAHRTRASSGSSAATESMGTPGFGSGR